MNYLSDVAVPGAQQNTGRSVHVRLVRRQGIVDRALHGRDRGLVKDRIGSLKGIHQETYVIDASPDETDFIDELAEILASSCREVIDDCDLMFSQECLDEVRAYEPAPPVISFDQLLAFASRLFLWILDSLLFSLCWGRHAYPPRKAILQRLLFSPFS